MEPAHGAGELWAYSNANYQVLGRLVEVVGGQPFPGYIETNILQPIGMHNSFVSDGNVYPSMATGHSPWFGVKRPLEKQQDRPWNGAARRGRFERTRPGALHADDDEWRDRYRQRQRKSCADGTG